jgi:hypothetical protein
MASGNLDTSEEHRRFPDFAFDDVELEAQENAVIAVDE